jgi:hypothetical protein
MEDTYLPGDNIDSPDADGPEECAELCGKEQACRAWTFVRNKGYCNLKLKVSEGVHDTCCVSGLREAAPGAASEDKVCEIDSSKMKGNSDLCHSFWEVQGDRIRIVHIVNSETVNNGIWKKPDAWLDSVFNDCKEVERVQKERCEQMLSQP